MTRRSKSRPPEPCVSVTPRFASLLDERSTRWGVCRARVLDVLINLALDKEEQAK